MADRSNHLVATWRVQADVAEVYDILNEVEGLTRWWPSVCRDVLAIQSGTPNEESTVYRITTRGWLPYVFRWHFRISHAQPPVRLGLAAWGDVEGRLTWTLRQDERWAEVSCEVDFLLNKPPFKVLRPLYQPLFASNCRWAMAKGEESLRLEIDRRHTREQDLALLPPPPQPALMPVRSLVLGVSVLAALFIFGRKRRKSD